MTDDWPVGSFRFPRPVPLEDSRPLRDRVRSWLDGQGVSGNFRATCDAWIGGHDARFSRALGEQGWIGMAWPRSLGGGGGTALERYVIVEELLAAGAPVAAHWFAERQVGPSLLRYGTEQQQRRFIPAIVRGECFFSIGMSEPDSGSDLASVSTRATRVNRGWVVEGRKIWTTHAQRNHYVLALCRTSPDSARQQGLTQFIVDLRAPGMVVRPIATMSGNDDFCEVVFDEVRIGDDAVLGEVGRGWEQARRELAFERSGPERFLSTFPLLAELAALASVAEDVRLRATVGVLLADLRSLRWLSASVARVIDAGGDPGIEGALVKDFGTRFEREVIDAARLVLDHPAVTDVIRRHYRHATLAAPTFTLRGGTSEVLRSLVARQLGLR